MEYIRAKLRKEKERIEEEIKGVGGDIYFYEELNPYLNPYDRQLKTDKLRNKKAYLEGCIEEIDFLFDLMDQSQIDVIYQAYKNKTNTQGVL